MESMPNVSTCFCSLSWARRGFPNGRPSSWSWLSRTKTCHFLSVVVVGVMRAGRRRRRLVAGGWWGRRRGSLSSQLCVVVADDASSPVRWAPRAFPATSTTACWRCCCSSWPSAPRCSRSRSTCATLVRRGRFRGRGAPRWRRTAWSAARTRPRLMSSSSIPNWGRSWRSARRRRPRRTTPGSGSPPTRGSRWASACPTYLITCFETPTQITHTT